MSEIEHKRVLLVICLIPLISYINSGIHLKYITNSHKIDFFG